MKNERKIYNQGRESKEPDNRIGTMRKTRKTRKMRKNTKTSARRSRKGEELLKFLNSL